MADNIYDEIEIEVRRQQLSPYKSATLTFCQQRI